MVDPWKCSVCNKRKYAEPIIYGERTVLCKYHYSEAIVTGQYKPSVLRWNR